MAAGLGALMDKQLKDTSRIPSVGRALLTPEELELARYETNFPLLAARHPTLLQAEKRGLSRLE
eukprot:10224376-Alexandrium_andersonii.AAC.1